MNIFTYDNPNTNTNTYIDPTYKRIYSTDIKYHKYCSLITRYNKELEKDEYFIACYDQDSPANKFTKLNIRNTGNSVKIDLAPIWANTKFAFLKKTTYLTVDIEEQDDTSIVYKLSW